MRGKGFERGTGCRDLSPSVSFERAGLLNSDSRDSMQAPSPQMALALGPERPERPLGSGEVRD